MLGTADNQVHRAADNVLIVGSGLAGLAAARALQHRGHRVRILERCDAPGGRVRDESWQGATLPLAAQFATGSYTRLLGLLREAGLYADLQPLHGRYLGAIRGSGQWHDADFASPIAFLRFGGIRARDRLSLVLRMTLALSLAARLSFDDLTSAPRLAYRSALNTFSQAVAQYLICPPYDILMGYKPEDVSLVLPVAAIRHRSAPLTLPRGMAELPTALARLCNVRYGVTVTAIRPTPTGVTLSATKGDTRPTYEAAAVIVATDAVDAAAIFGSASPWYVFLRSVRYSRADWMYVRTNTVLAPTAPSGTPLTFQLIPPEARPPAGLLGFVGFENHRVSTGGLLLLAAGAATGADILTDEELAKMLLREAESYHPGLAGNVIARRVVRWQRFVPVFSPAHIKRVAGFTRSLTPGPIDVAGDYLSAPWMEGAVRAGEDAAIRTHDFLTTRSPAGLR